MKRFIPLGAIALAMLASLPPAAVLTAPTAQAAQQHYKVTGFRKNVVKLRDSDGTTVASISAAELKDLIDRTGTLENNLLVMTFGNRRIRFSKRDVTTERTDKNRPPVCQDLPPVVVAAGSSGAGDVSC